MTMIALCGVPGSGKSEVQRILHEQFGIKPIDDGEFARLNCMDLFGMTVDDVYTQEGKLRTTEILGRQWQNRNVLGEYIAALESTFGEHLSPQWAVRKARQIKMSNPETPGFSFGSVRRSQGHYYRNLGAAVVEIVRPGTQKTGNSWDEFDQSAVTHTLLNDTDIDGLKRAVGDMYSEILGKELQIAA